MKLRLKLWIDYYVGTLLLMILKPPTVLLGKLLHRNHSLAKCSTVTYMKMMGGGSLVVAYPSLLAMRRSPGIRRLRLLTTPAIKPFGEALGVFDEIIVIRDQSLGLLLMDSVKALFRLFGTDALVDLEIFSRLTTVFALLSCARNRVGFYTNASFWRKAVSTHLLFCNVSNGIYGFYDQIAVMFGGVVPSEDEYRSLFTGQLGVTRKQRAPDGRRRIGVAPGCSDLSRERMLAIKEWAAILKAKAAAGPCVFEFLGGKGDRQIVSDIMQEVGPVLEAQNFAGELSLSDSVRRLAELDELICIDSALLHFSRLIGTPVSAYFGPTDPRILLRPMQAVPDDLHYAHISCSPCVHLAAQPPCHGHNLCMRYAADPAAPGPRNPVWLEQ